MLAREINWESMIIGLVLIAMTAWLLSRFVF